MPGGPGTAPAWGRSDPAGPPHAGHGRHDHAGAPDVPARAAARGGGERSRALHRDARVGVGVEDADGDVGDLAARVGGHQFEGGVAQGSAARAGAIWRKLAKVLQADVKPLQLLFQVNGQAGAERFPGVMDGGRDPAVATHRVRPHGRVGDGAGYIYHRRYPKYPHHP